MSDKKTILSGIQPSGKLCIANQLGAMGRENTFELFSSKKMAEKTLEVYLQFTDS